MSGRCVCCNRVLLRTTGKRKLPDGTLIEETFCMSVETKLIKSYVIQNIIRIQSLMGL